INDLYKCKNGTTPDGYPNTGEFAVAHGKPWVLDWSLPELKVDDEQQERAGLSFKIQRAILPVAADLPDEVTTETLLKIVDGAVDDMANLDNEDQIVARAAKNGRQVVREAKIQYLPRAKEKGQLTSQLVAETVVYEAA